MVAVTAARGCRASRRPVPNQYRRARSPQPLEHRARPWPDRRRLGSVGARAKRNIPAAAAAAAARASRRPAAGARKQPRRRLQDRGARTAERAQHTHKSAPAPARTERTRFFPVLFGGVFFFLRPPSRPYRRTRARARSRPALRTASVFRIYSAVFRRATAVVRCLRARRENDS